MLRKIKHLLKKAKRTLTFRPLVVFNRNTYRKQLFWTAKLRRKQMLIKKQPITRQEGEKIHRRLVIKHLKELQGKNYTLKVSKRYYANGKIVEKYYPFPTATELSDLYLSKYGNFKPSQKVKAMLEKTGLTQKELYLKYQKAAEEFYQKHNAIEELEIVDFFGANILVDIDINGKLLFTMVDF